MITVVILSYLTAGGFGFVPMTDASVCDQAKAGLNSAITWGAECSEIAIFLAGSPHAPEIAPVPPPKPQPEAEPPA